MARTLEIVLPPGQHDGFIREIEAFEGILGIRVVQGGSLRPEGDAVRLLVSNEGLHPLMRELRRRGIGAGHGSSVTLSEPSGVISSGWRATISPDTTDVPWEEMEYAIARESNMSANALLLMLTAGVFAAVGVWSGALHVVVAGMLIAPGFEPLVRTALGPITGSGVWRHGVRHVAAGYGMLFVGAAAAGLALRLTGRTLPVGERSYLDPGELLEYWTTVSGPSVVVSGLAATAGAILIANNRSVLTAGAMVGLSLVPTMAIVGLALVAGDPGLLARALLRWGIDAALVVVLSLAVFLWKRAAVLQREMIT